MKNSIHFSVVLAVAVLLVASVAWAAPKPAKTAPQAVPPFPGTLVNARYVYVTSYDGDQFNINLFPEDRQAISTVQAAKQRWGKVTLVFEPNKPVIVLMARSPPPQALLRVHTT